MGTWGVGPFDNDGAADLVATLSRAIDKCLNAKSNPSSRTIKRTSRAGGASGKARTYRSNTAWDTYADARTAIQILLLSHGTDILGGPGLDDAKAALERMVSDVEWSAEWKNPAEIRKQIAKELAQVKRVIAKCKACRRRLK